MATGNRIKPHAKIHYELLLPVRPRKRKNYPSDRASSFWGLLVGASGGGSPIDLVLVAHAAALMTLDIGELGVAVARAEAQCE